MECLKSCCRNLMKKKAMEAETQVITLRIPSLEVGAEEGRCVLAEDYLLSKLPLDGREVPFVLPTFRATYVQPRPPQNPNLQAGPHSSARCTYTARKAELTASNHVVYSSESSLHHHDITEFVSPGSTRRDTLRNRTSSPQCPGWSGKASDQQRLSSSMFDLSSPQSYKQRLDSDSSTLSSTFSSMRGSVESSLDSITLSGDERELGKVCVRVSYQEAVEQVWITLVQCSDLNLHLDPLEQQKIGIKSIITIPKPVHFKSSIKEYCQNVFFMETFVFALHLQQLRCSALVLRLQTHNPKKRTVAESVLSLRQLASQDTEHWLQLHPPSKSSVCHCELQLTTCFQPVNGRIQLQVVAAQNLPANLSPLSKGFYVKVEMIQSSQGLMKKKTALLKACAGRCQWADTFHFPLSALDHDCLLLAKLYSRSSVRRKRCLGQVTLGLVSPVPEAVAQWKDTMAHPEKLVTVWYRLNSS